MLTIQLLKPGRDTMDLLNDRNLQSRHQNWRQTPNLVPWEKVENNSICTIIIVYNIIDTPTTLPL